MRRSNCPISCTLDIIGDRWTLVILRDALFKGFTTYGEFQSSSEGIATNILASRLKNMVEEGIFTKSPDPNNKLKMHYHLTEKGESLKEVIYAVAKWGAEHMPETREWYEKMRP